MKRIICLILSAVLFVGCFGVLCSCGDETGETDYGAQIGVYLGDKIYDFDPTDFYVSDNVSQVLSLIFEPLFTLSKNGKLKLGAAKKYKVNKKERTIVITLRESYFSDGSRVTAQNFIYAWRDRILSPGKQTPAAALLYGIENAVEIKNGTKDSSEFGAVQTSTYEITIKYCENTDVKQLLKNLANVATSPINDSATLASDYAWSKSTNTSIGNGPFKISDYKLETGTFRLERNRGYHQSTSKKNFDKYVTPYSLVTFWEGSDRKVELTYDQIESKTLFFMGEATLDTCSAYNKKAKTADTMSTFSFVFNTTSSNPYLADPNVRLALSLALDRNAIAEAVVFAKAANGLVGGAKTGLLKSSADLDAANEALRKSSVTGAKKFTLTVNDDEASIAAANVAKQNWAELGFVVTVNAVDSINSTVVDATEGTKTITDSKIQALIKDAACGVYNFDVIAVDWQTYSDDKFVALCAFTSNMNGNGAVFNSLTTPTARANVAGWVNTQYDALVAEAMTKSGKERTELLNKAEEILMNESPIIPVLFNQNYAFVGSKLRGIKVDGFGNFVFTKAKLKGYKNYLTTLSN